MWNSNAYEMQITDSSFSLYSTFVIEAQHGFNKVRSHFLFFLLFVTSLVGIYMLENWQLAVFDKYWSNWGHEFLIFIFLILGPPIVLFFCSWSGSSFWCCLLWLKRTKHCQISVKCLTLLPDVNCVHKTQVTYVCLKWTTIAFGSELCWSKELQVFFSFFWYNSNT